MAATVVAAGRRLVRMLVVTHFFVKHDDNIAVGVVSPALAVVVIIGISALRAAGCCCYFLQHDLFHNAYYYSAIELRHTLRDMM